MRKVLRALSFSAVLLCPALAFAQSHSVILSWTPAEQLNGITIVSWNVLRGTASGGPFTQLGTVPVGTTSYTDSTVSSGQDYYYVVEAVNTDGAASADSTQAEALIPNSDPPLAVSTTSLPPATAGISYSVTTTASGGTGPYTWSGAGVDGLMFSATGLLSGTPAQVGTFPQSVTVKDSSGVTDSASLPLSVSQPVAQLNCPNTTFTNTVIKCVQSNSTDCGPTTDCSLAFGSNVTAGHLILVCADFFQFRSNANAIAATEAVNDSTTQGNAWSATLSPGLWTSGALSGNAQDSKDGCFTAIANSTAAETPHITTSGGGTPAASFIAIYEFSSVNGTIAVDATAPMVDGAGVGTTTCPSGNMTPAKNGDLLYGFCNYADGGVTTPGSGWTLLDTAPVAQGKGQATAASVNSSWVVASMSHWVAGAIAFSDGSSSVAQPPTVYIDTPAPGATVSGIVTVAGWAVDNASTVGTAISSVQVKVDGTVVGTATYGLSRSDVCVAYPGRPGCPNVGYSFSLDTSTLSLGTHTITVTATDSDGTPDSVSSSVTVNVQPPAPTVYIDTPASGATVSGIVTVAGWAIDNSSAVGTAISSVQVKVDGMVVGTATYGLSRSDVCAVYPGRPGCPNVGYSFSLNTLTVGTHTITVTATDSDGLPDSVSSSVTVNVQAAAPTVYIDAPASGATVSGIVTVAGWAVDNASTLGTAISSVQVKVDGTVVGTATYGLSRPDVCAVYPGRPGCPNVGYSFSLNTPTLTVGTHTITVTATDSDGPPDSGSSSVTVTAGPTLPTVFVDAPAAGSIVSGIVTVAGWAVDNASTLGTAISSVQVKIDGAVAGTATYGLSRPDVCAVYPGRPGCPNVGYSFSLDTSTLTVGTHTITVTATDSDATPDSSSASVSISVTR